MPKFLFTGSYTPDAWASMTAKPLERADHARRLIESFGGRLECFYWMMGEHDVLIILEAPGDVTAGAIAVKAVSGRGLSSASTHRLFTMEEATALMAQVKPQ